LGSKSDQLKSCLGIEQWIWMTKVQTRGQVENCVRQVTGTSDPSAYLNCIGLKQGWYKGKTGVFRASGDNLLRCIVQSETWCPTRPGKREADEVDEIEEIDVEARGLLAYWQADDMMSCMGNIANKFLTAITTPQGFADCIKKVCPNYSDSLINGVAGCVGLAAGEGPGPKCKWMDFWAKKKMMIMNNRGRFGRCVRDQDQKCLEVVG
jgi:hypothetical protein